MEATPAVIGPRYAPHLFPMFLLTAGAAGGPVDFAGGAVAGAGILVSGGMAAIGVIMLADGALRFKISCAPDGVPEQAIAYGDIVPAAVVSEAQWPSSQDVAAERRVAALRRKGEQARYLGYVAGMFVGSLATAGASGVAVFYAVKGRLPTGVNRCARMGNIGCRVAAASVGLFAAGISYDECRTGIQMYREMASV